MNKLTFSEGLAVAYTILVIILTIFLYKILFFGLGVENAPKTILLLFLLPIAARAIYKRKENIEKHKEFMILLFFVLFFSFIGGDFFYYLKDLFLMKLNWNISFIFSSVSLFSFGFIFIFLYLYYMISHFISMYPMYRIKQHSMRYLFWIYIERITKTYEISILSLIYSINIGLSYGDILFKDKKEILIYFFIFIIMFFYSYIIFYVCELFREAKEEKIKREEDTMKKIEEEKKSFFN